MGLLIPVAIYAYIAYALQTIAKKTNTKDEWLAWIPIVNLYLMVKIAKKPGWWVILLLIPLVHIVFTAIIWVEIAKIRNKPEWLGILMIIPFFNLVVFGVLAFSDSH